MATTKKTPAKAKKAAPKADSFAIIATGGKQYLVTEGQKVRIEKILGGHKVGDTLTFEEVLMTGSGDKVSVGAPTVSGAKVSAEITAIGKADKVTVIKYKAKSRYFKKRGHRQPYFEVKVGKVA
jgi:large subunit ribosomal protein L21